MNIIETLILAATVEMQERLYMQTDERSAELVDVGDKLITDMGLGPEDWDDIVTIPSPVSNFDYIHIRCNALN